MADDAPSTKIVAFAFLLPGSSDSHSLSHWLPNEKRTETDCQLSGLRLGGNDFDLDQELGAHKLRDDEEHRGGARVAEETRLHLSVGRDVLGTLSLAMTTSCSYDGDVV
jgi:hypothetical protein